MNDRSHLVATPIVDAKGKQTTVYRKPTATGGEGAGRVPAPAVAPQPQPVAEPTRAEAYAQRLADIAADNEAWGRDHPNYHKTMEWASGGLAHLVKAAAAADEADDQSDLAEHIGDAFEGERFSQAAAADIFAGIYSGLAEAPASADVTEVDALVEWQDMQDREARDYLAVFRVISALQSLDLMEISRIPDDGYAMEGKPEDERDFRFLTHLLASASGAIDYRRAFDGNGAGDHVRLIDEYPERLSEIIECIAAGLHAAAIRAQFDGDRAPALLHGEL